MAKASVNDNVAVVRQVKGDGLRACYIIVDEGVLVAQDRGKAPTDERSNASMGILPSLDAAVPAPGWSVVQAKDGSLLSRPSRTIHLMTQDLRKASDAAKAIEAKLNATATQVAATVDGAKEVLAKLGLDVETLTPSNVLRLRELLKDVPVPAETAPASPTQPEASA